MKVLTAAGKLRRDGALPALARIVDQATEVPASLAAFLLTKTRDAVIAGGTVTEADIALLRRTIFGGGGEGNLAVTREEAEALFAIDAACRSAGNDPAWPDFFAKSIGDCLTAASPYRAESRADAVRDETWLDKPQTLGDFARGMAHAPDIAGALHEALHPFADEEAEWKGAEADFDRDEAAAEPVTAEEWTWLQAQIARGGPPSEAVERLLAFLKDAGDAPAELPAAAPEPVAATAVPIATPSDTTTAGAPVFGHRGQPPVAANGASRS